MIQCPYQITQFLFAINRQEREREREKKKVDDFYWSNRKRELYWLIKTEKNMNNSELSVLLFTEITISINTRFLKSTNWELPSVAQSFVVNQ